MERCAVCGGELKTVRNKPYHYQTSGLNVTLYGVTQYECEECDERYTSIPNVQKLHRILGQYICMKRKAILRPEEITFLRKTLHLKAKELARALGVTASTVSRWENGKKEIGESLDRLLRSIFMMYAAEQGKCIIQQGVNLFMDLPPKNERKHIEQPKDIELNPQEWMTDTCQPSFT